MGSSQQNWQEMDIGVCNKCNKVLRVCRADGCDSNEKVAEDTTIMPTVAENATVDKTSLDNDKCEHFVRFTWALNWLAYYKAHYDGLYGKPGATTVAELREQSKTGKMPR